MTRPPRFPTGEVVRIAILVVLLVAVVVMKKRCGPAAESFFKVLDQPKIADGGLTSPDTARK
jgi:hypothetical protein